jgi:hypothetical protein
MNKNKRLIIFKKIFREHNDYKLFLFNNFLLFREKK